MNKIAVCNLSERELEDTEKIDAIARAVLGAILSIPRTGLEEKDISFTFPQSFIGRPGTILVTMTGASFFNGKVNFQIRFVLCRQVARALQTVLGREAKDISVEIRRPK